VVVAQSSPKPGNPRNANRISLSTAPASLLRLTEFLDNLVRITFPVLFRACAVFSLLWWWPKAPSCIQNLETLPAQDISKTLVDHEVSLVRAARHSTLSRPGRLQKKPVGPRAVDQRGMLLTDQSRPRSGLARLPGATRGCLGRSSVSVTGARGGGWSGVKHVYTGQRKSRR